jgi:hypothetical protein
MQVNSVRKVPRYAVFGNKIVFGEINDIKRVGIENPPLSVCSCVNSILVQTVEDKLTCSANTAFERTNSYPQFLRILYALGEREIAAPVSLEN